MRLENKVAVVTGGGRGIGKGISLKLAQEGASVIIASTTLAPAQAVAEEIIQSEGKACAIQTDVSDFDSVKNMVAKTEADFGTIDILVNNAGGSAREKMTLFADSEESTWDFILNTNLKGVFYTCRAVINGMLDKGQGTIVNIGSVAGMIGLASQVDYSAAKGGVIAFTQALAKEVAPEGVRVNCVSPGPITSDAGRNIPPEMKAKLAKSSLGQCTGFGHFGDPSDIANLVAFLASEESKYITGQNYAVCGVMNLGLTDRLGG
ncbi:SDR family NAD(P)-dependent oxidoreductase [Halioxenophilus aromaticivorans]|uniref:3-oxoacyl-[acyl-carrier-protein] reductase n=1 Tax=Halioxenophilus aromaticivorans TaxID=1306992 RepID=A0AAV3U9L5_9ALTE